MQILWEESLQCASTVYTRPGAIVLGRGPNAALTGRIVVYSPGIVPSGSLSTGLQPRMEDQKLKSPWCHRNEWCSRVLLCGC